MRPSRRAAVEWQWLGGFLAQKKKKKKNFLTMEGTAQEPNTKFEKVAPS